jgi:hypothetical protein
MRVKPALISTAIVAVVATFGDWFWAMFLSRHVMIAGLVHGALLCLAMGAVLGLPARRAALGAALGVGVGIAAAAFFYALAPLLRYGAMLPAWFALWVLLALAQRRLVRSAMSRSEALVRGAIAGLASGAAFYVVSGMWTRWNPAAIDYLDHLARWAFAFAPGFLALQWRR